MRRLSQMNRLNIDTTNVRMHWGHGFLLPILRNIIIGWEGLRTVYMMASHVDISVSSEVMAILSVAPTSKICANAWDALLWL